MSGQRLIKLLVNYKVYVGGETLRLLIKLLMKYRGVVKRHALCCLHVGSVDDVVLCFLTAP